MRSPRRGIAGAIWSGARWSIGATRFWRVCGRRICRFPRSQNCRNKSLTFKNASLILRGLSPKPARFCAGGDSVRRIGQGMPKPAKKHAIKASAKKSSKAKLKPKPRKTAKAAKSRPVARAAKPAKTKPAKVKAKAEKAAKPRSNGSEPHQNGNSHPIPAKAAKAEKVSKKAKASRIAAIQPQPTAARGAVNLDAPDIQDKLRELVKLAKEQGYITFDDLNEALPDSLNDP